MPAHNLHIDVIQSSLCQGQTTQNCLNPTLPQKSTSTIVHSVQEDLLSHVSTQSLIITDEAKAEISSLPFPILSEKWYECQGRLTLANRSRTIKRVKGQTTHKDGVLMSINEVQ